MKKTFSSLFLLFLLVASAMAQELQVRVNINSSKVQGTDKSVFENLQQTLEQFINEHAEEGWYFEGVEDHAFMGEWCCVVFSREQ